MKATRRTILAGVAVGLSAPAFANPRAVERIAALEARLGGGRLGLCAINTATGERIEHRQGERFAMASTFKWVLAAAVLKSASKGEFSLRTPISLKGVEILPNSPIITARAADGSIRIGEAGAAICQVSDNTAANLLLDRIGGPAGLTAFLRAHGDTETRLDRREMELNENRAGDPRDTTTPAAMAATAERFLAGDALGVEWRTMLNNWMAGANTGLAMLRAHAPKDWWAGDKTGRGANGAVNDVAIFWPPGRMPILAACYTSEGRADTAAREAVHADVGRILFETWA